MNDLEPPKTGDGQVKIEPAFVGICGTDLHEVYCSMEFHGHRSVLTHFAVSRGSEVSILHTVELTKEKPN